MANLILSIGVAVLSFCVVIFFAVAFANAIESVIAKHDMKRKYELVQQELPNVKVTR